MELVIWTVVILLAVIWLGVVFIGPPFVPMLKRDMNVLLDDLKLGKRDHVIDLGAGDGRVLQAAARRGARVSGVEINPFLVFMSRFRIPKNRGKVVLGNMWKYRLPDDTTHVVVFAAEVFMNKLEKYLASERGHTESFWVACYGFRFRSREPERTLGAFNLYRF